MQPSSSTRATIVSAENQNGATIVKATFFVCHYYIVWESNNAGEARGQSWSESLKSRWIPGGSCGYTSGTKRKHIAALSSPLTMVAATTIVRFPPVVLAKVVEVEEKLFAAIKVFHTVSFWTRCTHYLLLDAWSDNVSHTLELKAHQHTRTWLDSISTMTKSCAVGSIRTCAGRAQWISSPSP